VGIRLIRQICVLFNLLSHLALEGKAMAARVPKKGEPFSLPSNMVKP
jgi:hypothetical protein